MDVNNQEQQTPKIVVPASQTSSRYPLRVTRSQAQNTPVADLAQAIENEAENLNDEPEEGRFAPRRNLKLRKSLVAGYGDDEKHQRSWISEIKPLSVEERAIRLQRDSGVVLKEILEKGDAESQAFQMTMYSKWKTWEGQCWTF
jgi:hypothetical protein